MCQISSHAVYIQGVDLATDAIKAAYHSSLSLFAGLGLSHSSSFGNSFISLAWRADDNEPLIM
jgi:hypothetical protein